MANIFDILLDAKRAVRNNTYLSWGYIAYQVRIKLVKNLKFSLSIRNIFAHSQNKHNGVKF